MLNKRETPLEIAISLYANFDTIQNRVSRRMVCSNCGNIVSIGLHVERAESRCPRCGGELHRRHDDNDETLRQRMVEYREKSEPLISYYASRGILQRIDANCTPEEVFAEIESVLEK